MAYPVENVVETISTGERDRTLVVNCEDYAGERFVEIRQQSYGGTRVGWFTQSSIQVPRESLSLLRTALGIAGALPEMASAGFGRVSFKKNQSEQPSPDAVLTGSIQTQGPALRVWQAESA